MPRQLLAGIETGGTKILARLSDSDSGETIAERRWPTSSAEQAVAHLTKFLTELPVGSQLRSVGIASFGPLIIDPQSADYGTMQATTKPAWTGSNLRSELQSRLEVPVAVDSDVNAAAVAEQILGSGRGLSSIAYVTVGTGIGAGLALNGVSLKGAMHPEAGHLPVIRKPDDARPSICRYHESCAEGLASGPAVRARLEDGRDLAEDPVLVDLIAGYLGQLGASLVLAWSPWRIVWGGGIIEAVPMIPAIEAKLKSSLEGYGVGPAVDRPGFCTSAGLENAGLEGAMLMARNLVQR